ncbi:MAG: dephospho-CoA kinase [Pseudomonadota bacterium]
MIVIGLTGSIGMGKSTTAQMFADYGIPVHDADAAVHELYQGAAVQPVEAAFPGVTVDGRIDRQKLSACVINNPDAMRLLERIVHPLVRSLETEFLQQAEQQGHVFAVLEIPLLFETEADRRCDATVVVTAPEDVQRERVLSRPGMTADKLNALLAKQMPDAEKRSRADFLVETHLGLDHARMQVGDILATLKARQPTRTES